MLGFLKKIPLTTITNIVIGYMLLAFAWWAIHLWHENEQLFQLRVQLLEHHYQVDKKGVNLTEFHAMREYRDLYDHFQRQQRMVLGEGVFFSVCLMFGLYMVRRAANYQMAAARQRDARQVDGETVTATGAMARLCWN